MYYTIFYISCQPRFTIFYSYGSIILAYSFSLFNIKYEFIILNKFDINIHFAIPILFDIVTNNGVISPVIRNLIPYINKS